MSNENIRDFFSLKASRVEELRKSLESLLESYSGDRRKATATADLIVAKYSEKHRVYHNLSHISRLIQQVDDSGDESARLAVWFHDVVYDPKSATNEIDSAALAVEKLTSLNFPQAKIEKTEKMILATQKHDAAGLDADGELFLDIDLGILGANKNYYQKYAEAIREEYSFVPESVYREKRGEILQKFLSREFIYYTEWFRKYREERARRNIANEIKELSSK